MPIKVWVIRPFYRALAPQPINFSDVPVRIVPNRDLPRTIWRFSSHGLYIGRRFGQVSEFGCTVQRRMFKIYLFIPFAFPFSNPQTGWSPFGCPLWPFGRRIDGRSWPSWRLWGRLCDFTNDCRSCLRHGLSNVAFDFCPFWGVSARSRTTEHFLRNDTCSNT